MGKKQKVFLVDVDNTLFDTEKIRPHYEKGLSNKELKPYFKKFVFPDSLEVLKKLKKLGKVIIFSRTDHPDYQRAKIKQSGIERIVGVKNIILMQDKHVLIKSKIKKLKDSGFDQIFVLDDRPSVIEEAYKAEPQIIGVLIRYGKYKDTPANPDAITYKTESIKGAYEFLSNFIDTLKNYQIKKGLTEKQEDQLLKYTQKDRAVQKYTSDLKRFQSKRALLEWFAKKIVYTLTDNQDNLFGIIWFHPAPQPKALAYKITFAIRLYGDARGKGLARLFMEKVFKDFNQKKIWLSTLYDNIPGRRLYEHFGFKQITKPDENNRIIMIYG